MSRDLEAVIGLEVHVQLATRTKIFCGCRTAFGAEPNSAICPVCTGQPGALPVLNGEAVRQAVRLSLALGCEVRLRSRFARKSYFYPDLPKGYQVSQYDEPIGEHGALELPDPEGGAPLRLGITRVHMEEDAGKTLHRPALGVSLVDLNRAGVPLVEIVSEPDLRTPAQAAAAMRAIRAIVRRLGVSDGNMEEGSLRCDANVSLRPRGSRALGTKVEIKNLNSFRFVQRALAHEIERQAALLARGEAVVQETRLFDADRGATATMRTKEEADDYRYFPEPDLPPLELDPEEVEALARGLPELPLATRRRFERDLGLPADAAAELTREGELSDYFEAAVAAGAPPRRAASWIRTELLSRISDPRDLPSAPVAPAALADLLVLVASGRLGGKAAKEVWAEMWASGRPAEVIAEERDLFQERDEGALAAAVAEVIAANPAQVAQYRAGKTKVFGFFVGQVMKATRGKADPRRANELLRRALAAGEGEEGPG